MKKIAIVGSGGSAKQVLQIVDDSGLQKYFHTFIESDEFLEILQKKISVDRSFMLFDKFIFFFNLYLNNTTSRIIY
jgi:hypothetical protein